MRPSTPRIPFLFLACALLGAQGPLSAAEQETTLAAATAQQPVLVPDIGQALGSDALDALRGGESLTQVWTRNDGEVDGNTASDIVSGSNVIDGGAFANASGISTVIQNSGSNVLIQNGTAVNVQFVDPTP